MATEFDKFRHKFSQRPATFEAYVDVWERTPGLKSMFGSWVVFAASASAEPELEDDKPHLVERAEVVMTKAGYEIGSMTDKGERQWVKSA